MADSPFIYDIDEGNYEQIVLRGSQQVPVLVDFWATWCQPCQVLMPLLAKLVDEYNGRFILAKVNTEEQQAIAAQFGIRSIPTVKLFKDGQPVDEFAASDNVVAQAEQKLLEGDVAAAMALLEQARSSDPDNPRIVITMAHAQAVGGDTAEAERLLDELPEDEQGQPEVARLRAQIHFDGIAAAAPPPDQLTARLAAEPGDSEARYALAANQVMQGDISGALENLLLIMQRDRSFADDGARRALLKLFDMLGDDPTVTRYRARMFNLLH